MSDALADDLFGDEAATLPQQQDPQPVVPTPTISTPIAPSPKEAPSPAKSDTVDAAEVADLADDEEGEADLFGDETEATGNGFVVNDEDDEEQDETQLAEPELDIKQFAVPHVKRPRGIPIVKDGSRDDDLVLMKLPNFLRIDPSPYDPDTFMSEIQAEVESGDLTPHEQIRRKTMRVDNTIRWREADDGASRTSNARFVRWSDGSMSLQVGEEMFDCPVKSIPTEHNYLTLMHPEEGVLRVMGKFNTTLSVLPSGLASKSHADLKADIARRQQHNKNRGVKAFHTSTDPEALSREAAKAEADRIKARRRLETQKQRALGRSSDGRLGSRLTAAALDDNSDDEFRGGRRNMDSYDDDDGFVENDEDEDEEEAGAERLQALKRQGAEAYRKRKTSEDALDEAEAALEGKASSEEEEAQMTDKDEPKKLDEQQKKKARRLIFDSDDDE
jgi:RNA polymerase-associated protein LEO1